MATPDGLGIADLEVAYDALAEAIEQVGEEKAEVFLVKLALLNANALADVGRFVEHLGIAARDL